MKQLLFTGRFGNNPGKLIYVLDGDAPICGFKKMNFDVLKLTDEEFESIRGRWEIGQEIYYNFGTKEFTWRNMNLK